MKQQHLLEEEFEHIQVSVYNHFNHELHEKWLSIENDSDLYIYQRYSWNQYWSDIYVDIYDFRIVVVEDHGIPVVIYPFCINKKGIIRFLCFIGGVQSDYLMPVCKACYYHSKKIWTFILKKIDVRYDLMSFEKIPQNVNGIYNNFLSVIKPEKCGQSHGLILPDTLDGLDNLLKRSFRNDTKRQLRRIMKLGDVKFEKIDINGSEFQSCMNISIQQKTKRTKNSQGLSLFDDELFRDFYKRLFLLKDENLTVDYSILTLNNQVLATHLGFYDKKRYYFILPTIEGGEWSVYSCGKILIDYLLEFSIKQGHSYFDFTIGDESYKDDWCNDVMDWYSYKKHVTLKGFFYLYTYLCLKKCKYLQNNKFLRSIWYAIKHNY
jgi:CelD/BcsL family acetyltransferase involved in cellulose biosynthesis